MVALHSAGQDSGPICDKILPTDTSFDYLFLAYPAILNSINTFFLSIHTATTSLEDYEQAYIVHTGFAG